MGAFPAGGIRRRRAIVRAALVVMSDAFNVPIDRMAAATRTQANAAFPRQVAMYLCHVVGQLTVREVAEEFGREPSTVSHACHAIEDRRDLDVFDRQLTVLEDALERRLIELGADLPSQRRLLAFDGDEIETKAAAPLRRLAG